MIEAVNSGATATDDIREALAVSKAIGAKFQAFQSAAAATVAARERHGDGGAAVLAQSAGVSRRQAGAQARTNEMLKAMPAARGAVESGEMSFENARRLADAAAKTNADAVEADEGLLAQAVTLGEDDFAKSARRWALRQQPDGGEADYARRRARRYVRFWDADGMVHLKGEFDPLTGRRIQHRLEADARRALRTDRQQASATGTARTFAQCMADTLQDLTLNPSHCAHTHNTLSHSGGGGGSHHSPQDANNTPSDNTQPARGLPTLNGADNHKPSHDSTPANNTPNHRDGHLAPTTRSEPANGHNDDPGSEPARGALNGSGGGQPDPTATSEPASRGSNTNNDSQLGPTTTSETANDRLNRDGSDCGLTAGPESAKGESSGSRGSGISPTTTSETANDQLNRDGSHVGSMAGVEPANGNPGSDCGLVAGSEPASGESRGASGRGAKRVESAGCGCGRSSVRAQVAVVAHLDAAQSKLVGELAGGEPLPASVLEELLCNSEAFGVLFSNRGKPLWQGNKRRFADDNLMRALIARDGACVGCGAHYAICEGHHIEPVSRGGRTDIDNMVLACGRCHHRVHHDGWQVVVHTDRYSIEPPQRVHHGPAHAPERTPLFRRAQPHEEAPDALFADEVIDRATHRRLLEGARAALRASRNPQPADKPPADKLPT